MPYAESDGTRIHYEAHGEGEPLLLLMGYGLSSDAWKPMLPFLSGFRTILVDNRGTGRSDPAGESFTVHTMGDDAATVLDAAGAPRAHVHGVSMGGMIALALTVDHPEKVATLALGCTTPSPIRFMGDPAAAITLFEATTLFATDPGKALDMVLPLVFSESFLATNPSIRDLAMSIVGSATLSDGTAMGMMRAMGDISTGTMFDVSDRLGDITVPTLVQHGTADRLIPVDAGRYLAANIPGAEYQELEGAGHAYGMERAPEAFSRLMMFLAAHPISQAARAR